VAFVGSSSGDSSASFEATLSSLRREYAAGEDLPAGVWPLAAAFFLWDGKPFRGASAAPADFAFEDFAFDDFEWEPRPAEPPRTLPSDEVDAIASELALSAIADDAGLQAARRRFMWANHPDRRPDLPLDLANRRVAIANMLIDRELKTRRAQASR
jgi:hypothetical protein